MSVEFDNHREFIESIRFGEYLDCRSIDDIRRVATLKTSEIEGKLGRYWVTIDRDGHQGFVPLEVSVKEILNLAKEKGFTVQPIPELDDDYYDSPLRNRSYIDVYKKERGGNWLEVWQVTIGENPLDLRDKKAYVADLDFNLLKFFVIDGQTIDN